MLLEVYEYEDHHSPIAVFEAVRQKFGTPIALLEAALSDETSPFSFIAFNPIQEVISHENSFEKIEKALAKSKKFPKNFHLSGGVNWVF